MTEGPCAAAAIVPIRELPLDLGGPHRLVHAKTRGAGAA